jgi:hypothetical protein
LTVFLQTQQRILSACGLGFFWSGNRVHEIFSLVAASE